MRDVEAWEHFWLAGGHSPRTIRTRRHYVVTLASDLSVPIRQATLDHLTHWLSSHDWSAETRKSARSALRSFYGWLHLTGRVRVDPSAGLPKVRVRPGTPRPTPLPVFREAVAGADDRVRLMLQLARFTGLRRCEIAAVHTRDVEEDQLRVHGKGGKVRLVPLHAVVAAQLAQLPEGWAFPSRWEPGRPLQPESVGKLVSDALPDGWACHSLRHRAGTDWYSVDNDLIAVAELLGHSNLSTTRVYVALSGTAKRTAVHGVAS